MGIVHFNDEYERAKLLAAAVASKDVGSPSDIDKMDGVEKPDFSEIIECAHCKKEEPKVSVLRKSILRGVKY